MKLLSLIPGLGRNKPMEPWHVADVQKEFHLGRRIYANSTAEGFEARDSSNGKKVLFWRLRSHFPPLSPEGGSFLAQIGAISVLPLNIPALHGFGIDSKGIGFVVTDFVNGASLKSVSGDPQRLSLVCKEAIEQVAILHEQGIVLGNISEQSFVVHRGKLWLTGFIAHLPSCRPPAKEAESYRPFHAPEQVKGAPPTLASDVYALAVYLFESLLRRPFNFGGSQEAYGDFIYKYLPAMCDSQPAGVRWVRPVLIRALQWKEGARYANAMELYAEVDTGVSESIPFKEVLLRNAEAYAHRLFAVEALVGVFCVTGLGFFIYRGVSIDASELKPVPPAQVKQALESMKGEDLLALSASAANIHFFRGMSETESVNPFDWHGEQETEGPGAGEEGGEEGGEAGDDGKERNGGEGGEEAETVDRAEKNRLELAPRLSDGARVRSALYMGSLILEGARGRSRINSCKRPMPYFAAKFRLLDNGDAPFCNASTSWRSPLQSMEAKYLSMGEQYLIFADGFISTLLSESHRTFEEVVLPWCSRADDLTFD